MAAFIARLLGPGKNGIPTIGDNANLGVNVMIIGGVRIGNNITIGAGSVEVKEVPENAAVDGNPARVIKYKEPNE